MPFRSTAQAPVKQGAEAGEAQIRALEPTEPQPRIPNSFIYLIKPQEHRGHYLSFSDERT